MLGSMLAKCLLCILHLCRIVLNCALIFFLENFAALISSYRSQDLLSRPSSNWPSAPRRESRIAGVSFRFPSIFRAFFLSKKAVVSMLRVQTQTHFGLGVQNDSSTLKDGPGIAVVLAMSSSLCQDGLDFKRDILWSSTVTWQIFTSNYTDYVYTVYMYVYMLYI